MPESFIGLPPDSTGKRLRTRQRTVGSLTVEEQYVIPVSERVRTFHGMITTPRTLGNATVAQNIFTIENGAASTVIVALRRIAIQNDNTAASTAVAAYARSSRPTAMPAGGTVLTKQAFDTTETSNANVVVRGAASAEGGAATAITATAGPGAWTQYLSRQATAVGQLLYDDAGMIPLLAEDTPILLRPGQAWLVQVMAAATAANPTTNHYIVNAAWEEFTLP